MYTQVSLHQSKQMSFLSLQFTIYGIQSFILSAKIQRLQFILLGLILRRKELDKIFQRSSTRIIHNFVVSRLEQFQSWESPNLEILMTAMNLFEPCLTLTFSTSLVVASNLAITILSLSLYFSASSSHIGASFLQWPHLNRAV